MKELEKLIKEHASFLNNDYGFNIVKSYVAESFGNEGVFYERGPLQLRILKERGVFTFEFHPTFDKQKYSWYDLDIIKNYLENPDLYRLTDEEKKMSIEKVYDHDYQYEKGKKSLSYLKENIEKIIDIFSESKYPVVKKNMNKLENQRSKRLFG